MNPEPAIQAMSEAAQALQFAGPRERALAIQAAKDALDAAQAVSLAELDASREFELDGCSTLKTWVRTQLRMNAGQATALVRCVGAMRDLSLMAQAALSGQISAAHVRVFVYGLAHVGLELMRLQEEVFVQVACEHGTHPEDLDDAWEKGMGKQDFQVDALPDGWHVTGFLNTVTGAKLKKVLDSVSAPDGPDDTRTGSERRVQGLDDLLSLILGSGDLPSDKGLKPHVSIFADADTVAAAAEHVRQETQNPFGGADPMPPTEPATMAGHGHIGPNLLMYFMCVSEVTRTGYRQAA